MSCVGAAASGLHQVLEAGHPSFREQSSHQCSSGVHRFTRFSKRARKQQTYGDKYLGHIHWSGSCRCAIIVVPWYLRRLSLFSTCQNRVFDKQILPRTCNQMYGALAHEREQPLRFVPRSCALHGHQSGGTTCLTLHYLSNACFLQKMWRILWQVIIHDTKMMMMMMMMMMMRPARAPSASARGSGCARFPSRSGGI